MSHFTLDRIRTPYPSRPSKMPKRKRSEARSASPYTSDPPSRALNRQRKLFTQRISKAQKDLVASLRLGAGFERQKYSRRKKTAKEKGDKKAEESTEGASKLKKAPPSRALKPPLPRSFYQIPDDALQQPRYRVFGMTARILVDAARVAYGEGFGSLADDRSTLETMLARFGCRYSYLYIPHDDIKACLEVPLVLEKDFLEWVLSSRSLGQ